VKRELEQVEIPDEHEAHERAWQLVETAFAEREPQPQRRSWKPIAAIAVALIAIAGLLSPPGRAVLDEIREVVGVKKAQPALFSLPAPGRLLVTSDAGAWVVDADGSKRLLGTYREASWSPFGRFVVASRQNDLVALTPEGELHWTLARPDIRFPRWGGTRTDTRIAYFSGETLRVVVGNGKGDRLLDAEADVTPPVWLPGSGHRLAYARRDGSVRVVEVDTETVIDRNAPRALLSRPREAAAIRRLLRESVGLGDPLPSPDGRWLAVGWPDADQLLFVRTSGRTQIRAVSNVSRQFRSRTFPRIEGWCCLP
jgi:hypothetical protein